MEFKELYYEHSYIPYGVSFKDDKISGFINIDYKSSKLDIGIKNKCKYNRKKIDVSYYLRTVYNYIVTNHLYKSIGNNFVDTYDSNNVRRIEFIDLKLQDKDIYEISKYKNLMSLNTKNCTFYKDCNLGRLKCYFRDVKSDIYSMDMFNLFNGESISLRKSHIVNLNKHILHLNCMTIEMYGINLDYERFILTTDAPNLRKIIIHRNPSLSKLKHNDLLFISGFYNLESTTIDAIIKNYDQFEKLEFLRELKYVQLQDPDKIIERLSYYSHTDEFEKEINKLKYKRDLRMYYEKKYIDLKHELSIDRLKKVEFMNSLNSLTVDKAKQVLEYLATLSITDKRNYLRKIVDNYTMSERLFGLDFDRTIEEESDVQLVNSKPFSNDGIEYYVLKKKRII